MPRGITNISGVSCHITSALQLIYHCLPSFRKALIGLINLRTVAPLLRDLGRLFQDLQHNDEENPVDPSTLYRTIENETSLDSNNLGDAVRALRTLLHMIRSEVANYQSQGSSPCFTTLSSLLDLELHGCMEQVLIGRQRTLVRRKVSKRVQACPFPIPNASSSVKEGLLQATIIPQEITGYSWDNVENYQEMELEDSAFDSWVTCKTSSFQQIPTTLLLHVQRYSFVDRGIEGITNPLDIPHRLDMNTFCKEKKNDSHEFTLTGCLLHVLDSQTAHEEHEGGHYVALVRFAEQWVVLNDEDSTELSYSDDSMMDILSGRVSIVELNLGSIICPTLLVYSTVVDSNESMWITFMEQLNVEIKKQSDEPNWELSILGQRVKILWAKGKYFTGTVVAYDAERCKHKVEYDDGDVKEYNLRKKTLEWI